MSTQSPAPTLERRPPALLLAPESPYPLVGGGALRAASVLEFLTQHYAVDLVVFRQPGAPDPAPLAAHHHIRRIHTIGLPYHARDPVTKALRNGWRLVKHRPPLIDRFSGFEAELVRFVDGYRYDLAVIEHFWCAPYLDQLETRSARVVLDLHNVESVWHQRCAEAEARATGAWSPVQVAHRVFREACLSLERAYLPRFACVLATSQADAEHVRGIAPGARVHVYPNALPWRDQPRRPEREIIGFSGSFDYEPNRLAVRFFARQVWPRLRHEWPALTWRLIGRHPASVADLVAGDPRIECSGPVEDAVAELAGCKVVVVPLLSGSGTRLKIVEAWAAGRAVVSTTLGAEGLPAEDGRDLILADEPDRFAAAVSDLLASPARRAALGARGRALFESRLHWATVWPLLGSALAWP